MKTSTLIFGILAVLFSQIVAGQQSVSIPDTPAGDTLRGWLDAFNSGSAERLTDFYEERIPTLTADRVVPFMARSGGLDVVAVRGDGLRSLDFVLKERASDVRGFGRIVVDEGASPRVIDLPFARIPPGVTIDDVTVHESGTIIDAATRSGVIDAIETELVRDYVSAELADDMVTEIRRSQSEGVYDDVIHGQVLAASLTQDLQSVSRDLHLNVRFNPLRINVFPQTGATDCGIDEHQILSEDIGYLKIDSFRRPPDGTCDGPITEAMSAFRDARAIIVDLRENMGGDPNMVAFVSTYFFDAPTHLNSLWARSTNETREFWTLDSVPGARLPDTPVYVLTSSSTFSAAEEFAYNLKALQRATIVGETTRGGAHTVRGRRIDDRFSIGVPNAMAINPVTGTNWEGTGVIPDIAAPVSEALDKTLELIADGG